ncbi:MAG TPA: protein translocase subunit SecD [Gemmatimonadaceae bacterium]|nr:protein translocase subunit SecD [Gemmatimonadaceae bacterium]
MSNLKYRILVIVALVAASLWALFPRTVVERVNRGGQFVYDTVQRVPLKRGLDLQGGMHLALELDESGGTVANRADALDQAMRVIRNRIDEFGVSEPVVQKVGESRIIVELPGIDDAARAASVVEKAAFLEFQITDKTQALERVLPRLDQIARDQRLAVNVPAGGDTATGARPVGGLQGLLRPGSGDTSAARAAGADSAAGRATNDTATNDTAAASGGVFSSAIQKGQLPGQFYVATSDVARLEALLANQQIRAALPPGKELHWGADSLVIGGRGYRELWMLDARPIITGEYITDARPQQDPASGNVVAFQLNTEGARRFRVETGRHIGDQMAIVLDDRVVTAPTIQSAIGRNGQITLGQGARLQEAQDLALVLRAGALQTPLKVVESRSIGPSLGQDSIQSGLRAGVLGVILVVIIMVGYYRFSGLLAVGGLALFALFTAAMLAGMNAVLTLPGIAGFVLSIGMAVDANFLIFERIREELDAGRSIRTAIDSGFHNALSAIIDSNVTTALTAIVLYQFGTGPVRGFAVTLLAGLAASMVTAIFVVRTFFLVWLNRRETPQTLSI